MNMPDFGILFTASVTKPGTVSLYAQNLGDFPATINEGLCSVFVTLSNGHFISTQSVMLSPKTLNVGCISEIETLSVLNASVGDICQAVMQQAVFRPKVEKEIAKPIPLPLAKPVPVMRPGNGSFFRNSKYQTHSCRSRFRGSKYDDKRLAPRRPINSDTSLRRIYGGSK